MERIRSVDSLYPIDDGGELLNGLKDQTDTISIIKNLSEELLNNIVIKGVKNIDNIVPIIGTSRNTKGVIQLNPICGKSQFHSSIAFTIVSTISRPPNRIRSVTGIP